MVRIGVIGFGYWGPNIVRNLHDMQGVQLVAVSDEQEARRALVRARYPDVATPVSGETLVDDPHIDAVVIATPLRTHFDLGLRCLEAGKHVLLEKPMCASAIESMRLIREAEQRGLILMVGHTYCFTSAIREIKARIDDRHLGEQLYYYDSVRANLGRFQSDVNVISDLAVHDIAILDHLIGRMPDAVSTTGVQHIDGGTESLGYLTLHYPDRFLAHIHVSWLAPVKVRKTVLCGSRRMLVYDDMRPDERIRIYDTRVERRPDETRNQGPDDRVDYHVGEVSTPKLEETEALEVELRHFIDSIVAGTPPLTDGHSGLRVVQVLEAAQRSLRERRAVSLSTAAAPIIGPLARPTISGAFA